METSVKPAQDMPIRMQQQPQEDSNNQPQSPPSKPKSKPPPKIHTYHCLCTHLLFASTHNLAMLPRRHAPGLDSAIIVPLPPPPPLHSSSSSSSSSPSSSDNDDEPSSKPHKARKPKAKPKAKLGYTLFLTTSQDRKPHIISRADGFEKRYLWRCGRCRLIVGYQLDDVHFPQKEGGEEGDGGGGVGKGRGGVLYLLPGGLMTTEEMAAGKVWGDKEIELGGEGEE